VSRGLENPINWSFPIGSLFDIRIRIHVLFVLGGLFVVFQELDGDQGFTGVGYGLGSLAILFLIVLLHEFGHCFGARSVGGSADEILLWPLGGLAFTSPPHNARAHLITVVAGPLVNVVLLVLATAILVTWKGTLDALPLNPFAPFQTPLAAMYAREGTYFGSVYYWLVVFFTLNFIILLFNLMPVYPFDGGRVLQCILWMRKDFASATLLATGVGMVGAIAIGIVGVFTEGFMLFGIAIFGYVTCMQQRQAVQSGMFETENEFGYDFSRGFTSLEGGATDVRARKPSMLQRWRANRDARRTAKELEERELLTKEIDRILAKVHDDGLQSLTANERALLKSETQRQQTDD
jgi:stage IV sporulation protein FB